MKLKSMIKPYPMMIGATFTIPLIVEQNMEPWPGRAIAVVAFVALAIAALSLERSKRKD